MLSPSEDNTFQITACTSVEDTDNTPYDYVTAENEAEWQSYVSSVVKLKVVSY